MIKRIAQTAGFTGLLAALVLTLLQSFWVAPLILEAETFEKPAPTQTHDHAVIAPRVALKPTPRPLGCQMTSTSVKTKTAIATNIQDSLDPGSAAGRFANRTAIHVLQTGCVVLEPIGVGPGRHLQDVVNPGRKIRIEAVIDPLALTTIKQQTIAAQLRQVAADFWLAFIKGAHQFTHAQLTLIGNQQGRADAGFIGQALEEFGGSDHEKLATYGIPNIRISIYGWQEKNVQGWVNAVGLEPAMCGTHAMRRTKASLIYCRTKCCVAIRSWRTPFDIWD